MSALLRRDGQGERPIGVPSVLAEPVAANSTAAMAAATRSAAWVLRGLRADDLLSDLPVAFIGGNTPISCSDQHPIMD